MDNEIILMLKSAFDYADETLNTLNQHFKTERKRLKIFSECRLNEVNKGARKKRCFIINSSLEIIDESKLNKKESHCLDVNNSERTFLFTNDNNNNKVPVAHKQRIKATKKNSDDTPVTTKVSFPEGKEIYPARLRAKKLMDISNHDKTNASETLENFKNAPQIRTSKRSKYFTFDDIKTDDDDDDVERSIIREKLVFPWWSKKKHLKVLLKHQKYVNEQVCNTLFCNKSIDVESLRAVFPSLDDESQLLETSGKEVVN